MSLAFLTIDSTSTLPPYEQIKLQIMDAVKTGILPPGAKLPTVRSLAGELGLAANTVARAYRELEHHEIIETRGRNGSFIAASGDGTLRQAQQAAIAYADRAAQLGLGTDEALALVASALNR
ncbi:GntR family transcriptional regulator [Leifsonia sp. A12D58]|uniref:GntR family transcriptional regulator n=1 Tax=Leifsonia sp. A12D58 TaxID=3397674 RepID=UPI0039DFA5B8